MTTATTWKKVRAKTRTATINGIEYEITSAVRSGVKWWYLAATLTNGEHVNVAYDHRLRDVKAAAIKHAAEVAK
jgi:hypothetical protein